MAEDDAAREDFMETGGSASRSDITQTVSIEAAVTPGSGITGPDYGAAGGVNEPQSIASDFTGSINSEPTHDLSGRPEGAEQT